jgi:hypothetical protein
MNYEARQRRLDRARFAIWAELLIGLMVVVLTGYLSISAASEGFPLLFYEGPPLIESLLVAAPVVSFLGWVWMVRLSRPQPEAGDRSWRYRDGAA